MVSLRRALTTEAPGEQIIGAAKTNRAGEQFTGTIPKLFDLRAAYGTSRTLCTPAATETPDPAACGNHHSFRTNP
jgi:hypothetical protein